MNVLSCGIRMWVQVYFVLSQCTRLTDGRTDGQKGLRNTVHCITCSRSLINECIVVYITSGRILYVEASTGIITRTAE